MDPERWQRVAELFHAALERPPGQREAFLASACDDTGLRREVVALLASHEHAQDFIETPAFESAAELLRGEDAADAEARAQALVGRRLGPYEINATLGHGGMGVVYLAEDTRLGRRVALKALAGHLGGDERSRARLRREAKAAAALSHPSIATVFALEELDGQLFIAYEYAEGPTLRDEIAGAPRSPRQVLSTALELARGLAAAHRLGIVHRDLKPENVVRTADGGVKILDFGLAAFTPAAAISGSGGGEPRLTLPGMLLGTPSYMSPEQLKGGAVDFRSDLFSLGVLLYELASGVHPFEGNDPASTIARILEVEPRRLDPAPLALPAIEPLLDRLLAKTPEQRYGSTVELVTELEKRLADEPTPAADTAAAAPARLPHAPFWWWRFHQIAIVALYGACLWGLWLAKEWAESDAGRLAGTLLLYGGVALAMAAGSLRLHLAFAARYYPAELERQRGRAQRWIRPSEFFYAVLLFGGAALLGRAHSFAAALMVASASAILVFAHNIEPATTRAAFPPRDERNTSRS